MHHCASAHCRLHCRLCSKDIGGCLTHTHTHQYCRPATGGRRLAALADTGFHWPGPCMGQSQLWHPGYFGPVCPHVQAAPTLVKPLVPFHVAPISAGHYHSGCVDTWGQVNSSASAHLSPCAIWSAVITPAESCDSNWAGTARVHGKGSCGASQHPGWACCHLSGLPDNPTHP